MNQTDLVAKIQRFLDEEGRSCSMDPGIATPEYICRMWGGRVPLEEIEEALNVVRGK